MKISDQSIDGDKFVAGADKDVGRLLARDKAAVLLPDGF
jgi:hypothetical protein